MSNSGKIIKGIAIISGILGVVGSIIIAVSAKKIVDGLWLGAIGAVASIIGAFLLYSFGELIECVALMDSKLSKLLIKFSGRTGVSNKEPGVKNTLPQQGNGNQNVSYNQQNNCHNGQSNDTQSS